MNLNWCFKNNMGPKYVNQDFFFLFPPSFSPDFQVQFTYFHTVPVIMQYGLRRKSRLTLRFSFVLWQGTPYISTPSCLISEKHSSNCIWLPDLRYVGPTRWPKASNFMKINCFIRSSLNFYEIYLPNSAIQIWRDHVSADYCSTKISLYSLISRNVQNSFTLLSSVLLIPGFVHVPLPSVWSTVP